MITKPEYQLAAKAVASNITAALPKVIGYKGHIQKAIIKVVTHQEVEDVLDGRLNQGMVDKLCKIAKNEWALSGDALSLYYAAMAVATIIKEYGWGTQYLVEEGMWEIAQRIQNA